MLADRVFEWLSQQPAWQQDLARRLLGQAALEGAEYAESIRLVKVAHGVPTDGAARSPQPLVRGDLARGAASDAVQLLSLGNMRGVGLVTEDARLTFGDSGLTIIYGGNGTGKSSYVKALKKLCRTVDLDCEIRSSVYEAARGAAPSAEVRFAIAGDVRELRTLLVGDGVIRLPGTSVFDTASAELYVDKRNVIQYVPTELRVFSRMAAAQDKMRADLGSEHERLKRTRPTADPYPDATAVGRALRALRGSDKDADLRALATLDETDREQRDRLRGAVAAAAASTSAADAAAAMRDADEARHFVDCLNDLASRVAPDELAALRAAAEAHAQAREALSLAAKQLRGPVEGVGGEPWHLMWEAAKSFLVAAGRAFPPSTDEHCPLCLQTVDDIAAGRLAQFEEHIHSTLSATAEARATEFGEAQARVSPSQIEVLQSSSFLVGLRARAPSFAEPLEKVLDQMAARLSVIVADPAGEDREVETCDVDSVVEALTGWADLRADHAATLHAADDPVALGDLKRELAELDARDRLAEDLDQFEAWRVSLRTMQALDSAHSALATNRLTTAQRELAEDQIGAALDAALTAEMQRLDCRLPVRLLTTTARAQTRVAVSLNATDPPPVSAVASEGEQRALALAFFLAELAAADDAGGIVLDDPVSSLDDDRRIYIARRLSSEAQRRQVIVFTHDLPFVFELRAAAKNAGLPVHFQSIWRQGDAVGRVDDDPPFKTLNLTKRLNKLDTELQLVRKNPAANLDAAWQQVDGFYSRLRTCWERAVEERVFGGVVQRFERDVKTKQFKDMRVSASLLEQVDEGMTRASRFVHEDSFKAQIPLPSVDDMTEDLERLRRFDEESKNTEPLV